MRTPRQRYEIVKAKVARLKLEIAATISPERRATLEVHLRAACIQLARMYGKMV